MIVSGLRSVDLRADPALRRHDSGDAGGIVTFEGITRSAGEIKQVAALEYDAYERRANRQLNEIAEKATSQWSLSLVIALHRTGTVPAGEPGVIIVAGAAHRSEAFDACEWIIDTIKNEVAIWKRELYVDGSSEWLDKHKAQ